MGPVSKHLHTIFPELPSVCAVSAKSWSFDAAVKALPRDFYSRVLPLHPVLNLEYSVLCNQLREELLNPKLVFDVAFIARLESALMLAELLEHIHFYYLDVPREVERLRQQQQVVRTLLGRVGYSFVATHKEPIKESWDLSLKVRNNTVFYHVYRILTTRSKRLLDLLNTVLIQVEPYNFFVTYLDRYTNPFFTHLSWFFNLPRLLVHSFLLFKHLVPGEWMSKEEQSLAWYPRFIAQIQRRWFELGNDVVWVGAGIANAFILIGILSPVAYYVSLTAFIFDVLNAAARAYVELSRLDVLHKSYTSMLASATSDEERQAIASYLVHLDKRITFERCRHALHTANMTLTCIFMVFAAPALALNPMLIVISAVILLLIWLANFILAQILEAYRPVDALVLPAQDAPAPQAHDDSPQADLPCEIQSSENEMTANTSYSFTTSRVGFFAPKHQTKEESTVVMENSFEYN